MRGSTLYVADGANFKVRTIDLSELDPNNVQASSVIVATLAGSGSFGTTDSTNGTGTTAQFRQPEDFAFGPGNFLYVSDTDYFTGEAASTVRQVNATTGETHTVLSGYDAAAGVVVVEPYAYIADCGISHNTITRWELGTSAYTDFVGLPTVTGDVNGVGLLAKVKCPYGLGLDPTRSFLYFSDWGNRKIKRIELATATVTTVAGTGSSGLVNGDALTVARLRTPNKIAVAPQHIFVAEFSNCAVRQLNLATSQVTTIAGAPSTCARNDGPIATATFGNLIGIYYAPAYGLIVGTGDYGWGGDVTNVVTLIH